uniref:Uncharacterized protein n=1 Tax=Cacopsylla melanoneura TaxID=428564 RepID=A0A8D8R6Y1_9HEMI
MSNSQLKPIGACATDELTEILNLVSGLETKKCAKQCVLSVNKIIKKSRLLPFVGWGTGTSVQSLTVFNIKSTHIRDTYRCYVKLTENGYRYTGIKKIKTKKGNKQTRKKDKK